MSCLGAQSFYSLTNIDVSTRSRTIRDSTSARISVPSLLRSHKSSDDNFGTTEPPWTWRTDLAATKPFWEGWFVGLSRKFLEGKGGKLLLLAGTDRLDKELMIGQMQGMSIFDGVRLEGSRCREVVSDLDIRQISAPGISGRRPFHSRRSSTENGCGGCRLLQT